MAEWPRETLFVVYCAGPHCNGADRAALKIARLGRPVKIMIGGITGWPTKPMNLPKGRRSAVCQPNEIASQQRRRAQRNCNDLSSR